MRALRFSAAAAWARRGLPPNEHSGRWMGDDFGMGHRLRDGQRGFCFVRAREGDELVLGAERGPALLVRYENRSERGLAGAGRARLADDALLLVRQRILTDHFRIDGRGITDIRTLSAEVDVIPRAHGSALFERGETQIMGVTTLNMLRMEQQLDTLSPVTRKRYMHNYNFPPYSTGETGRVGSPKRREIGHGALAERALVPVLPSREQFPYAIRQVSEALGSNGSTSMGSVCASSMALQAAGDEVDDLLQHVQELALVLAVGIARRASTWHSSGNRVPHPLRSLHA